MSNDDNSLRVRIRHRRRLMGMRLADLAGEAGISESMMSKIEHGKANPSLKTLHRIAGALGLSASALFYASEEEDFIGRDGERPLLNVSNVRSGTDITLEALVPHGQDRLLQANIHIIEPGGHTDGEYFHEGEDVGYVLEGELEITLDSKKHLLKAGDSFFFRSDREHGYRNPGKVTTRVLWVNTPPSF